MSKFYISYKEYSIQNPSIEQANEIVEKAWGSSEIVSEGGGSIIDIGKYVARELKIPHTAIPTTAGTGSEVTKYCVLNLDGRKTTFTDEVFIPTSYILNPMYLESLSKEQKLSSRLDALSQCYESLWSIHATHESLSYANIGISLLENPKNDMDLMIGANMSGRAINIAKTNVCHAISYPLTDLYGIPHGFACYLTLKYFANKLGYVVPQFDIPDFDYEIGEVASIAIQNTKMEDFPEKVEIEDIIKSLS